MVDDDRMPIGDDEEVQMKSVQARWRKRKWKDIFKTAF